MEKILEPVLSKFHRDKVYNERRKIEIDVVNKCFVNIVKKEINNFDTKKLLFIFMKQ